MTDSRGERRDERRRIMAEINEAMSEALTAHSISDDQSELLMLDDELDDRQQQRDALMDTDAVGMIWFGDDWIDKRLNRDT